MKVHLNGASEGPSILYEGWAKKAVDTKITDLMSNVSYNPTAITPNEASLLTPSVLHFSLLTGPPHSGTRMRGGSAGHFFFVFPASK